MRHRPPGEAIKPLTITDEFPLVTEVLAKHSFKIAMNPQYTLAVLKAFQLRYGVIQLGFIEPHATIVVNMEPFQAMLHAGGALFRG